MPQEFRKFNKQFKQWGILGQVFCHDIPKHGLVFNVIATITQITIENGEPLFDASYSDLLNIDE